MSRRLDRLQGGESSAAGPLWGRYFHRLVALARQKLRGAPRAAADEEDVALSAFDSFCRAAEAGRFPELADRDDLWRVLVALTARKVAHLYRDRARLKRGGGKAPVGDDELLLEAIGREPTPEFAAELAEEYRRLLGVLGDEQLEAVAVWRMEGYGVDEIATKLGCAPRSVKRKLQLIRTLWAPDTPPTPGTDRPV